MSSKLDDFFTPTEVNPTTGAPFQTKDDFFTPLKQPSRLRSLLSAFPKGFIKGMREAGSLSPLSLGSSIPKKLGEKATEEILPTQRKVTEEFLERTGKLGAFLSGGEGSLASKGLRALAGAFAGQSLKQLDAPELVQDIAELSSMSLPELSKNIPARASQKRVIDFLRRKGFTEREITPLIQSPEKLSRYASFAQRGRKTDRLMKDIYSRFDQVYEGIREQGKNLQSLPKENINSFLDDFQKSISEIRPRFRKLIQPDIEDLLNSDMKFNDFVDFFQDVNAVVKGQEGGKAVIGKLKQPILNAQRAINPELTEEFQLANELYGKRANVVKALKPNQIDSLLDMGETVGLAAGIADQNLNIIKKTLGSVGARHLAREMLINSKLQNLSNRMLNAFLQNKIPIALKLYNLFKKELESKEKN